MTKRLMRISKLSEEMISENWYRYTNNNNGYYMLMSYTHNWLDNNCQNKWYWPLTGQGLYFENNEDKVLFQLTWG